MEDGNVHDLDGEEDGPVILRPGLECDLAREGRRFVAEAPGWALDSLTSIHKAAVTRVSDALGPSLLGTIRDVRDGKVALPEGMAVRYVPFPTPWKMGLAIEPPGERGYLFAVDLDVPLYDSPSVKAARVAAEDAKRAELAATGLAGDELDSQVSMAVIVDEIMSEEAMGRSGDYPGDLPSPDTVDRIDEIRLTRYALPPPSAEAPSDPEGFARWAAATRASIGKPLQQIIEASASGGHFVRGSQVFQASPSRAPYEGGRQGWAPGQVEIGDPVAWMSGLAALRPLLEASGRIRDVQAAAREVGARRYVTFSDGHGIAEDEMGQALALAEDGLPGLRASEAMAAFEADIAAMALQRRLEDAGRLATGLAEAAGSLEGGKFVHNDLDNSARVETVAGTEVLTLTDQNGQFVVALGRDAEGQVTGLAAARYGLPLSRYLESRWREGPVTMDEVGYGDFHRDHANALDPGAPLGRVEATAAVVGGRTGFPGFLGSYEMRDGCLACVSPPPFDLRTMRDLNTVKACLESGRIEFDEEMGRAPSP